MKESKRIYPRKGLCGTEIAPGIYQMNDGYFLTRNQIISGICAYAIVTLGIAGFIGGWERHTKHIQKHPIPSIIQKAKVPSHIDKILER